MEKDLGQNKSDVELKDGHESTPWKKRTTGQKIKSVLSLTFKFCVLLCCLYFFMISLELLTTAFRLVAGANASKLFDNKFLTNPLAGLMLGVLATVIVQSSSTATSIIVSLVASGVISKVSIAIPIIMGCNIGTSVTGVLVSFAQVTNKERFRLSFAGATVNDMFNILSVLVFLPLELVSHYLEHLTGAIVSVAETNSTITAPSFIKALTNPFIHLIVQLDKDKLKNLGLGNSTENMTILLDCSEYSKKNCDYLFEHIKLPEWSIGLIILAVSLTCLCICLIGMVKVLSSLFKGSIAKFLQKTVNSDLPGPFKYLTGYVAILIGCGLTIIVQSSSAFISSLNPLVGMGVVSIERIFPLTLGSNIGTTVTGLLAAFAASTDSTPDQYQSSLRIALCHSFFNMSGILLWYPIPFLRRLPIFLATKLGDISAEYRWFAIVYLLSVFVIIPLSIFGLSIAGKVVFLSIFVPIITIIAFIILINILQAKASKILPDILKTWKFLPEWMRSLKPCDRLLRKTICTCKRFNKIESFDDEERIKQIKIQTEIELHKFKR